jgi:hypothetical protein
MQTGAPVEQTAAPRSKTNRFSIRLRQGDAGMKSLLDRTRIAAHHGPAS